MTRSREGAGSGNEIYAQWLKSAMGKMSKAELARRVGVSEATIRRHLNGKPVTDVHAAKTAEVLGRSHIEGLIEAGILPEELRDVDAAEMAVLFAQLPPELRAAVRALVEQMVRYEQGKHNG